MHGYPKDLRSDELRKRAAQGTLGDVEAIAARVLARLTGERVTIQDDNSQPRTSDIRIDYTSKPPAYVEVVTDVDEAYARTYNEIRRHGWYLDAPRLDHKWWLSLTARASFKRLRRELEPVLAEMTRCDELFPLATNLDSEPDPASPRTRQLRGLGVASVASAELQDEETGVIHVRPVGTGGHTEFNWQEFQEWIAWYLAAQKRADVRGKLAGTGATERHVFVGTSMATPWAVTYPLHDEHDSLPPDSPHLPQEITHLWLWSAEPPGRCLAWFPGAGWFDPRHHWSIG